MFADDTTMYKSCRNAFKLYEEVNIDLQHLHEWFESNKLSLNNSKTIYLLFQNNKKVIHRKLQLIIANNAIQVKRCG